LQLPEATVDIKAMRRKYCETANCSEM